MKVKILHILIALLLLPMYSSAAVTPADYGLKVNSVASMQTEATGLSLDEGNPIPLRGKPFTLSFSLQTSSERPFGCVVRLISGKEFSIDLMHTVDNMGIYRPQVIAANESAVVPVDIPWGQWVDVSLTVDPDRREVLAEYNGTAVTLQCDRIRKVRSLGVSFGNCMFDGFTVNSVSSVAVRDIMVKSAGRVVRHWPLMQHSSTVSYDLVSGAKAVAVNPLWIVDRSISFTSIISRDYPHFVDVVYDGEDVFHIIKPDGDIVSHNLSSGEETSISSAGGICPSNAPNQSKWCNDSTLLSYCIAQNLYGTYDIDERRWSNSANSDPGIIYWNVTSSWDHETGRLYSFGGYGFHHFSNILRVFSPDSPAGSSSFTLDKIAPRSFASSLVHDGCLYIFGGEGSQSGSQGIMEEYFYDLHKVDLDTFEETLVWDSGEPSFGRFLPGENMVYDELSRCFYTTAITGNDFILVKISEDAPSIEPMSLPAGVRRDANIQYTNIYRNNAGDRLYALFIQTSESGTTNMDVMTIPLPLSRVEDIVLPEVLAADRRDQVLRVINVTAIAVSALAVLAVLAFYFMRRRRARMTANMPALQEYYDFSSNSISLFGTFSVRNRNGEDITSLFSPTLRKLLSALILYTVRYKQGIPGEKLNQLIWGYKPEGTASNNRNVYISRLRSVLEELDGVVINTKNKYLSISLSDEVTCDYKEIHRLYDDLGTMENVGRLLSLLFRGPLLPNMEDDWVEQFRNECSSRALGFLNSQFDSGTLPQDMMLKMAETVILYDRLNERAMKVKCQICHSNGNIGPAKEIYDAFCREYKAAIGEDYKVPFKQIIV